MRLLCGRSNLPLARAIAARLGCALDVVKVAQFADGEISVELTSSVRGEDVFIVQPTSPPVNDHLMELLLIASACSRASARSVTAVIPYFGYARQDRLSGKSRTTISAADVAQLICAMGVSRVVTCELHAAQIQGFFPRVPVDDLSSTKTFVHHLPSLFKDGKIPSSLVIVSPDAGGVARAKRFRDLVVSLLGAEAGLAIMIKHRVKANAVERMDLVGSVEGAHCILVDDMTDTSGTLLQAARILKDRGATAVFACVGHGVLSDPATQRLKDDQALERLCILDTIDVGGRCDSLIASGKVELVSSATMLANAISAIAENRSLTEAMLTTTVFTEAMKSKAAAKL